MEEFYLLGMKQGGWLTQSAQYSTSLPDAAKFTARDAISRCRLHRAASNTLIPVPVSMMEKLK